MKKYSKLFCAIAVPIIFFGCSTEDKTIDQVFDNTRSGIILRNIDVESGEFDNNDPATAAFKVLIEIQDTQNGSYTNSIRVYAEYQDNNGTGNNREETLVKTIASSNFFRGDRGLLRSRVEVSLSELKTALNLTDSQVKTCDVATIRLEAVATDGRVFTNSNSSPTITGGSYFSSPFQYSANIVGGALPDSLAGNHTFTTTGMFIPGTASCGGEVTGTITWTETGTPGVYSTNDMSFGLFESSCWNDAPAVSASSQVKWFCKTLTALGADQYGSTWSYSIVSVVGPVMKIEFISTYLSGEGGTVTITREGGVDWPAIMQD
jgi:hypothetical protein